MWVCRGGVRNEPGGLRWSGGCHELFGKRLISIVSPELSSLKNTGNRRLIGQTGIMPSEFPEFPRIIRMDWDHWNKMGRFRF